LSYALDVNVLLYASDKTNVWFGAAKRFLEERIADPDLMCLT
jgi:hypothetical protein